MRTVASRAAKVVFFRFWFYLVLKKGQTLFFQFFQYILYKVQTKLFTVYLMIYGDCENNFVFINAQYVNITFFLFLG